MRFMLYFAPPSEPAWRAAIWTQRPCESQIVARRMRQRSGSAAACRRGAQSPTAAPLASPSGDRRKSQLRLEGAPYRCCHERRHGWARRGQDTCPTRRRIPTVMLLERPLLGFELLMPHGTACRVTGASSRATAPRGLDCAYFALLCMRDARPRHECGMCFGRTARCVSEQLWCSWGDGGGKYSLCVRRDHWFQQV